MEINFSKNKIEFEKELNELDKLAISFGNILNKLNIRWVIVSGYVAILFGRSRASEDIDIIFEEINYEVFFKLWIELKKEFQCDNNSNPKEAYEDYLSKKLALRFSKNKFIPNIEVKFPKSQLDEWTIDNRKEVHLNNYILFISPFELQIPFKLSLGTPKDIEDAKHIYSLFKQNLDMKLLLHFNRKLKIADLFNKYLDNETSKD